MNLIPSKNTNSLFGAFSVVRQCILFNYHMYPVFSFSIIWNLVIQTVPNRLIGSLINL